MATKNDVTGDRIVSRPANDHYRDNWDTVFGSKDKVYIKNDHHGYVNIIVDYHNNPNCSLRLTTTQYAELCRQIIEEANKPSNQMVLFEVMP